MFTVSYPKSTSAGGGYGQRDQQTHMHTYSLSVTPRVHLLVVGMGREINTHTCIHTVCQLPQEYTGWWWVWAERCTRSLFCQTRDQQTPMHTYRQSVSYPKSTSAGSRYRQRDVHEGLEGHGLLATRPAHQRRLELTLAGKIHINFDFHAAPPFFTPFIMAQAT